MPNTLGVSRLPAVPASGHVFSGSGSLEGGAPGHVMNMGCTRGCGAFLPMVSTCAWWLSGFSHDRCSATGPPPSVCSRIGTGVGQWNAAEVLSTVLQLLTYVAPAAEQALPAGDRKPPRTTQGLTADSPASPAHSRRTAPLAPTQTELRVKSTVTKSFFLLYSSYLATKRKTNLDTHHLE